MHRLPRELLCSSRGCSSQPLCAQKGAAAYVDSLCGKLKTCSSCSSSSNRKVFQHRIETRQIKMMWPFLEDEHFTSMQQATGVLPRSLGTRHPGSEGHSAGYASAFLHFFKYPRIPVRNKNFRRVVLPGWHDDATLVNILFCHQTIDIQMSLVFLFLNARGSPALCTTLLLLSVCAR